MKKNQHKNIRWGIIGLGKIAHKFAKDLCTVNNTELYAVASRSEEKADEFTKKFDVKITYQSYEDLAKDTTVDAIYIATPHSFHKEHTLLCLQHKKAVLCEKPLAMNLYEVEEMIGFAKKQKVLLIEALWTCFMPHYQFVLQVLKSKKLGKIQKLEADFGFEANYNAESRVFKKELGGGSLLDIGIYPIFLALATLGIPENIIADASFYENGTDASCNMIFEYHNAKAMLKSTFLEETPTEAIFTCEHGILKINSRFHEATSVIVIENGVEEIHHFKRNTLGYNYEIAHFNQLIKAQKTESDLMTFDFSKNLIQTMDSIREIIGLTY